MHTLNQAARALTVLAADPRFSALTIAELNPTHGAEDGSTIRAFIEAVTKVFS